MRVLVFTDEYDYGYYTFIYNEIERLKEAGIEVCVVCERIGKLKPEDTGYYCIPLTENKLLRNFYLSCYKRKLFSIISCYSYFRKRKKIIRSFQPDLIHVHFGDTAVKLYFTLEKTLRGYPYLVSFHGFDASTLLNQPQYSGRLRELMLQPGFHAICVSEHVKNNLISRGMNINPENSSLLYYGIDITKFQRTRHQNNEIRVFLQISGFFEKKGHVYTLLAFKEYLAKNPGKAKLVIGGDGPLREEIANKCKELELTGDVELPGWISRDKAVTLLNEADYFVHHSITAQNGDQEGLPNAIIEAMSMELPVISTYHSGIPELVEDGVNGFLVGERDIAAYTDRMEKIIAWSYLPANREKIRRQFSLEVHTERLLSIYKRVSDKKTGI